MFDFSYRPGSLRASSARSPARALDRRRLERARPAGGTIYNNSARSYTYQDTGCDVSRTLDHGPWSCDDLFSCHERHPKVWTLCRRCGGPETQKSQSRGFGEEVFDFLVPRGASPTRNLILFFLFLNSPAPKNYPRPSAT